MTSNFDDLAKLGITPTGWFTETEAMWPGQKFSLALDVRTSVIKAAVAPRPLSLKQYSGAATTRYLLPIQSHVLLTRPSFPVGVGPFRFTKPLS
jgi:hypothetical protein